MFNCFYCKSKNGLLLAKKKDIRLEAFGYEKNIFKCCDCNLVQLYPLWTNEECSCLYDNYSKSIPFKEFKKRKRKKVDNRRVGYKNLLKYISNKNSRILDIGCGDGHALDFLNKNGFKNAIGIEKNPLVCDGKRIFNCDFLDFHSVEKFDFVYSLCVYNYINDPYKFIENISLILKKGGIFFLETYNFDDPISSLYKNKSFEKFKWDPYNCFFYDRKTIHYMFDRNDSLRCNFGLSQRYGLLNHLTWLFCGTPSNHNVKIPIIDNIYSFILTKIFKRSDAMFIVGQKIK